MKNVIFILSLVKFMKKNPKKNYCLKLLSLLDEYPIFFSHIKKNEKGHLG